MALFRTANTPMIDRYRWWEIVAIYGGIALFLFFLLAPFRRYIPPVGMFDISFLVAFIVLEIVFKIILQLVGCRGGGVFGF